MHSLRLTLQASIKRFMFALLTLTYLLAFTTASYAHEDKPAVAIITISNEGIANIAITLDLEAIIAGVGPEHALGDFKKAAQHLKLRKMSPSDLTLALNDFTGELLAGIQIRADDKLLITSLESSDIPESDDPLLTRESVIHIKTKLPESAKSLSWQWNKDFGIIALRLHSPTQQDLFNAYLEDGIRSEAFALAKLQ